MYNIHYKHNQYTEIRIPYIGKCVNQYASIIKTALLINELID